MMTRFVRSVPSLVHSAPVMNAPIIGALAVVGVAFIAGGTAVASPRSERVAARIAERAYARQAIAEARAAQAQARVAQIAPLVPPPPPSPATIRRLARAGVMPPLPLPAVPSLGVAVAPQPGPSSAMSGAIAGAVQQAGGNAPLPASPPEPSRQAAGGPPGSIARTPTVSQPSAGPPARLGSPPRPGATAPAVADPVGPAGSIPDGTRSVLVIGEEPAEAAAPRAVPPATVPPIEAIELLPVPDPR